MQTKNYERVSPCKTATCSCIASSHCGFRALTLTSRSLSSTDATSTFPLLATACSSVFPVFAVSLTSSFGRTCPQLIDNVVDCCLLCALFLSTLCIVCRDSGGSGAARGRSWSVGGGGTRSNFKVRLFFRLPQNAFGASLLKKRRYMYWVIW